MQFTTLFAALALGSAASAHMALQYPAPFRAAWNPNSDQSKIDYSITSPLNSDGSNFPCKGYQVDMGTPAGASVVTWTAGGSYNFSVEGGATHGGGSCQASLSYDQGKTFKVIHSYIGSCPLSSGEDFKFTMPADAPTGSAMFAWTWYNEIGNREIYMDCASITIDAGSGSAPAVKFADRPDLFVANLDNGCTTVEGKEVQFPDPGPSEDVTTKDSVADDSGSFTGTCAAVKGIGGGSGSAPSGSGSGSGSGSDSSSPSQSSTPAASTPAPTTMSTVTTSAAPFTSTGSHAPGVFATVPTSAAASSTPSPSADSLPATTPAASPAAASSTVAAAPPSGTGSALGSVAAGTSCTTDGMWNCVGGNSFQQCASGTWSVVMPLADGTSCTPGQAANINIAAISRVKRNARRSLAQSSVRRQVRREAGANIWRA